MKMLTYLFKIKSIILFCLLILLSGCFTITNKSTEPTTFLENQNVISEDYHSVDESTQQIGRLTPNVSMPQISSIPVETFSTTDELIINKAETECITLKDLSERAYSTAYNDNYVEDYLQALWDYIINNQNLEFLRNNQGVYVMNPTEQNDITDITLNLIRYDGNPIGLGTLERTWTFLQIVNNDKIEAYKLYSRSAEYPLNIKEIRLDNNNVIVSIIGVTNMSRKNTAFISFWEYSINGLSKYENIEIKSNKGKLYDNECILELYENDSIQIKNALNQLEIFDIIGNKDKISVIFSNNTIIITG